MAKSKKARQDAATGAATQDEAPAEGGTEGADEPQIDSTGPDCGQPSGLPQAHEPMQYDRALSPAENVERAMESPAVVRTVTVGAQPTGDEVESALGAADGELRTDGPTLEEYVAAGYSAETYPPRGYAPVAADAPLSRYRPTHPTLTAEVASLAREAFQAKDFAAHGELHQVEMAIAHLRRTMTVAKGRLKGEPYALLEQLLEGL